MVIRTYVLILFAVFGDSHQLEDFYDGYEDSRYKTMANGQMAQLIEIINYTPGFAILINDKPTVRFAIDDNIQQVMDNILFKNEVYLMRFNSTGVDVTSGSSIDILDKLFAVPYDYDESKNGNAYFAILKAIRSLPYNGVIMLFTDHNIGDKQLLPQVVKELIVKNIKLYIIWIDSNLDTNLNKIASLTGGDSFNNLLLANDSIGYFRYQVVLNDGNLTEYREYNITLDEHTNYIHIRINGSLNMAKIELEGNQIDLLNQDELNNYPGSFVFVWNDQNIIVLYPGLAGLDICTLLIHANTRANVTVTVKSTILNVQGQNNNNKLERLEQLDIQRINTVLPKLTIELGSESELLLTPQKIGHLYFTVTNHHTEAIWVTFSCTDEKQLLLTLHPQSATIDPKQTTVATVTVTTRYTNQNAFYDTITLRATGDAKAEKTTYLYVNNIKQLDVEKPHLWYTFTSDCLNVATTDCSSGSFALEIFGQDKETGLMQLSTSPAGIYFPNNFISGTKNEVIGYYSTSCCNPDVVITAVDLYGNRRVLEVNAYQDATFSAGIISAIVLGVILLILLIAVTVYGIRRLMKRKATVHLPTYRAPANSRIVH